MENKTKREQNITQIIKNSIDVAGIGYEEYDQVLPSFNNYFEQGVTKLGFQNGRMLNTGTRALIGRRSGESKAKSKGYCESSYNDHLWMCTTKSIAKFYADSIFVDKCDRPNGYIPYPWYIFGYGCHCECVLQSDYPEYDPECYPCIPSSKCCTITNPNIPMKSIFFERKPTHKMLVKTLGN